MMKISLTPGRDLKGVDTAGTAGTTRTDGPVKGFLSSPSPRVQCDLSRGRYVRPCVAKRLGRVAKADMPGRNPGDARRSRAIVALAFLTAAWLLAPLAVRAESADVESALRKRIGQLATGEVAILMNEPVVAVPLLTALYEAHGYGPLWQDAGNREALLQVIARSGAEGLTPGDFHWASIRDFTGGTGPEHLLAESQADVDILFSDALALLSYQLFYGKVDPHQLDPDWNFSRPLLKGNWAEMVVSALQTRTLPRFLAELRLQHPYYLTLKAALRSHREIASSGGWRRIPDGPALKTGAVGPRVAALRFRLAASGDYNAADRSDVQRFDGQLDAAVRRFQERHGLDADGIVGSATLAELNIPVEARIEQIRVNMERARWVLRNLGDDFIVVNIAGFYLELIRDGRPLWESPVIVGTPYRKTPVFTAPMRYIEFNPTWTIPRTILREDILPKVKADPGYLAQNGFRLFDFQRRPVDAAGIDWARVDGNAFPYLVVQDPGPGNALGLVKFMLPNAHDVYLHDTPSRGLFRSASRTFSSGCIRVKDPFELAELLLSGEQGWTRARMAEVIEGELTTRVNLAEPLPVLILYWTVDPDPGGTVRFYRDVYDRDGDVLDALNAAYRPNR